MTPIFKRYAEALYKAARGLECTDAVADDLPAVEELIAHCIAYMNNPLIDARYKAAVLRALLSDKVNPLTMEFILMLAARRHLKHFRPAAEQFRRLSGHGKVIVRLRVPYEPEQSLLGQLRQSLVMAKLIPKDTEDAQFDITQEKELVGGFVASCDGYQIDTSLKTALTKILRDRNW